MIVTVDRSGCIACGACVATCDSVFEIVDGASSVKPNANVSDFINEIDAAVSNCPVSVISVEE